jgi:hypothetical protein
MSSSRPRFHKKKAPFRTIPSRQRMAAERGQPSMTEIETVGAGGGGGGGGAGTAFYLQAPNIMIAPRVIAVMNPVTKCRFMLCSSYWHNKK